MENNKTVLLKTGHMARKLGVPVSWLREEAKAKRIPAVQAGNVFLFCPEVVEQILLKRARTDERSGRATQK